MTTLSTQKHSIDVIKKPRVTEKATLMTEKGQYVFEVTPNSTKASIKKAIAQLYKVTPVSVNIVRLPSKSVVVRGRIGRKTGIKKAYITLKKGDTIDIA